MEYGALCFCVMVFGKNDLLLSICTAYCRAVTVAAFNNLSAPDALDPGQLVGMLLVR
ncbi:MAG: hypothetical protein A4E59_01380 [Syntrophorhabdus sp. PtaB.Bin027]|nr:MAG: hypothetical protein A4E59_01380 [Syntrophorhabdus sp. PtaB.Bin027]